MSYLLIEPIEAVPVEQTFKMFERLQVQAVRPYLYLHNDPTGSIKVAIKYDGQKIASKTLTVAEILNLAELPAGQYHYGFFTFDIEAVLNIKTEYQIEVSGVGYGYDPNSYFGWIKPHENLINTFSESVLYDDQNPFGFQLWGYK